VRSWQSTIARRRAAKSMEGAEMAASDMAGLFPANALALYGSPCALSNASARSGGAIARRGLDNVNSSGGSRRTAQRPRALTGQKPTDRVHVSFN
jgi:hypothetical protein